jgi:hypothetical protein
VLGRILDGLGFDIVQRGPEIRAVGGHAEYGRLARKRQRPLEASNPCE